MDRDPGAGQGGKAEADFIRRGRVARTRNIGEPAVNGTHDIPVVIAGTGHAGVSGLDGPAGPPIPSNRRAIIVGLGPLAAHLIKAPAEPMAFIPPFSHKLAGIEVHPPFTVVMDSLPVAEERPKAAVEGRV